MDIKIFMSQLHEINKSITAKLTHIQLLRENAVSMSVAGFTAKTTSVADVVGKNMSAVVTLEASVREDMAEYEKAEKQIKYVISKITNYKLRNLLTLRYINLYPWVMVSEIMGMSYYHITSRMHLKALIEADKILAEFNADCK